MTTILGIESSCDETSVAIVTDVDAPSERILSHIIRSQTEVHAPYGGVVPELSSRAHVDVIDQIVGQALDGAKMSLSDVDAIAVTSGPGLIGGVMVGVMTAKGLAFAANKPLVSVNHLEGHALTVRLTNDTPFPYLMLLVSGGHCQFVWVAGVGDYQLLGQTLDDALGEAYDKVAKMLSLGYPGGPIVENRALEGDENRFNFPSPLKGKDGCDFSFSGLKTAVYQTVEAYKKTPEGDKAQFINDICASFQRAACDSLIDRLAHAIEMCPTAPERLVVAGGVAANTYLTAKLAEVTAARNIETISPPLKLCTDNGAMIAWAGLERFRLGERSPLTLTPQARWPLSELAPPNAA